MAEGENPELKPSEIIEALLREIIKLPDILFVMGKSPQAVMEGWVSSEETQVTVGDDWVSVESKLWHCHLHLTEVKQVRFVEEPDVHNQKRRAFSVRLDGENSEPLLMIFFGSMYDDAGLLLSDRVDCFRALRKKYGLVKIV